MSTPYSNPDTIGTVAAVESEQVLIELDPSTRGLVKAGSLGVVPVGSINSYVTMPAGAQRILAVVTAIKMFPEHGASAREASAGDESRQMVAVMVGRFQDGAYHAGIVTYPSLFAPVMLASQEEIAAVFSPGLRPVVRLGEAVVAPDQDVLLDADTLLGRHCAVLGSTGAGKSCSVVAILDGLLELDVPHSNIVIFDSNGEYEAAFGSDSSRWSRANPCVIGPREHENVEFVLPHWFMNNEEHIALLSASELTQTPLLQRAVGDARLASGVQIGFISQLRIVARSLRDIREIATAGKKPQETLRYSIAALEASIDAFKDQAESAGDSDSVTLWVEAGQAIEGWQEMELLTGNAAWNMPVSPSQYQQLEEITVALAALVEREVDRIGMGAAAITHDFDAPRYYSLEDLHDIFLPNRVQMAAASEQRVIGYATTLFMRLARLLADSRYDFMTRVDKYDDALAAFLRLMLGLAPGGSAKGDTGTLPPWSASYARHVEGRHMGHSVTIVDLSLIASDVLENVTALLGRLVLEFAQRVEPRGDFPILLVLEEAHRYIPAIHPNASPSRSAVTFERIAKEGRKFGVGLILASQRPSELSRTVLAQCGTLIAHRMTSPDDQELVRHASPFASRDVLRQLPGLATQHAVVLGEAVAAPTYVRVRTIEHTPRGRDPEFIAKWRSGPSEEPGDIVDRVARNWEQSGPGQVSAAADEPKGP